MIEKLLVAYDGSKQSEKAYSLALNMASKYSAQVILLSVARPPESDHSVERESVQINAAEYCEGQFRRMKEEALSLGVETSFQVRVGNPADAIVQMAEEEKIDAIVMGHRGESFLQRWLLGSVAKRVLSFAPCTVMVVR